MDVRAKQRLSYRTGLLNSNGLGGDFAPRQLRRYMLRGKFKDMRMIRRRKFISIFIACLFCSATLFVAGQRRSENNLPKDLVQKLIADINNNKNNFRLSDEDLEVLHKNLKFELHDLNADGVSEFFLYIDDSNWCGAGANCNYWVYQKTKGGYILLIEDKVLRVKETKTNGYRDLSSEVPMGFCKRNVQRVDATPYKYDGKQYQAQKPKTECQPFTPKGI
jgi:hypothetical protein